MRSPAGRFAAWRRAAKYFFFNDYGTYGRHFDAAKWIDSREQPLPKPKLMQIGG